ncbi:hypothetical protein IIC65_08305, partial [Candidatus Sumerlaeota bacterium]|nr:hypothetical protein [Candidatus Sumerlaeota bacterium]
MRHVYLVTCFAVLAVSATGVRAQDVPDRINYQGKLLDALGNNLADGSYDLEFSIFSDQAGTVEIWGPQIFDGAGGTGHGLKVPVVNGQFNVILGPGDTTSRSLIGVFRALPAGVGRFVQITVEGLQITPLQEILSVPVAMFAAGLPNVEVNTRPGVVGNVGIGVTNPQNRLDVAGGGVQFQTGGANVTIGTQGGAMNISNTAGTITIVNGKLGIRRPNPVRQLEVAGNALVNLNLLTASLDVNTNTYLARNSGNVGIGISSGANTKLYVAGTFRSTGASFLATNGGNVGIGTTTPIKKIHVV